MTNKAFLLGVLDEQRLRSLAETWGYPSRDRRLRAPGIAKDLARKRSLTVGTILEAMNEAELAEACRRVGLATEGTTAMRRALDEGLARERWKALRRDASAESPRQLVPLQAELVEVIDGTHSGCRREDRQRSFAQRKLTSRYTTEARRGSK